MYNKKIAGSLTKKYMTKKDYIAFAKMLKEVREDENKTKLTPKQKTLFDFIVCKMVSIFEEDNEKFSWEMFSSAVYD